MKFNPYIFILVLALLSCKEDPLPEPDNSEGKRGILVLNEGLYQQNNASLSFIDQDEVLSNDYFLQQNGRLLGDTGNDMIIHGAKIYIVVHASSTIEVLDKSTLKSIQQIQLNYQGANQQPRFVIAKEGYIYVSSYDGFVNIIDTASFLVEERIAVGNNPEGLAISNDLLFVANSGGLNSPNYDSTVSVIDLNTHQVTDEIFIGANLGEMLVDAEGDIYVVKRGDYGTDESELFLLDAQNSYQVSALGLAATSLFLNGNELWVTHLDYSNNLSKIALFNTQQETVVQEDFLPASEFESLYGVFADEEFLYCLDARGFTLTGKVKKYNKTSGTFIKEFEVGLNPNTILKLD